MGNKDPLHLLMKDIQRDLLHQRNQRIREHNEPKIGKYSHADDWKPARCIELIHITEGSIGSFIEYYHRSEKGCRRLLPAPAGTPVDAHELVSGEWWLRSRNQGPMVPADETTAEVAAIKARFNELMDDYLED